MGLIFVGGLTLALVIGASALPIRAWRRNDNPPVIERHFTDGTKTIVKETRVIDGRTAQTDIKLLQMPAQPQAGAFPELLRAAYAAGHTALPGPRPPAYAEAELPAVDLAGGTEWETVDGWDGDIRS